MMTVVFPDDLEISRLTNRQQSLSTPVTIRQVPPSERTVRYLTFLRLGTRHGMTWLCYARGGYIRQLSNDNTDIIRLVLITSIFLEIRSSVV